MENNFLKILKVILFQYFLFKLINLNFSKKFFFSFFEIFFFEKIFKKIELFIIVTSSVYMGDYRLTRKSTFLNIDHYLKVIFRK